MKSFAHELIMFLPYKGLTVAFSPCNNIIPFLDWTNKGEYIKKMNMFMCEVETEVHKVILGITRTT